MGEGCPYLPTITVYPWKLWKLQYFMVLLMDHVILDFVGKN